MHRASEPSCAALALARGVDDPSTRAWSSRGHCQATKTASEGPMTPEDDHHVRTRPKMRGDRTRRASPDGLAAGLRSHEFTVQTTLRNTPATHKELLHEIRNQLADFDPRYRTDSTGRMVITLQVRAADLRVAVLLAMGAVTRTGYQPEEIVAKPSPRARNTTRRPLPPPDGNHHSDRRIRPYGDQE